MVKQRILERPVDERVVENLMAEGFSRLLARIFAARGVLSKRELDTSLASLIPPDQLLNNVEMAKLLADAIEKKSKILVVGDYDSDGATATAVAIKALRMMGAQADFLVPNRFEYGYGLTPEIVRLAATLKPDFILTVDNGIASVDGVLEAKKLGISVLVTDHHLPGEVRPDAACIVNPNQIGCTFPSKHLAGVGVLFYVMLALRAEFRARGRYLNQAEPNLTELLDLVALGTVADLVKLDSNNRILVEQGLKRIRAGKACAGMMALMQIAGRDCQYASAQDMGFSLGPRLNAAGRLDDMSLGINCLLETNQDMALQMAQELNQLNLARREIESDMQVGALLELEEEDLLGRYTIAMHQQDWHQGVIGILASRIKEKYHRPVVIFADAGDGLLKGSGRSINGLHLRDALDLVTKIKPNLILKFGGHAMAAGLTIKVIDFQEFEHTFEQVVSGLLTPSQLESVIEVDGQASCEEVDLNVVEELERFVWGQGFPAPYFYDHFKVLRQRVVGERHLKLTLQSKYAQFEGIYFQHADPLPDEVDAVYQLQSNKFNGKTSLQINIKTCV